MAINYLKDKDFLRSLDNDTNKFFWVKIEVLDMDESAIANIEGRVQPGSSISINGSSAVRRTCNITFIAEDEDNDLSNVENLLSINKKIRIKVGIKNNIDTIHDPIIWFPQGIFVINQPSITHNTSGCTISLSCKDKMCLLNGENGGGLPTSITFDSYDQIIGMKEIDQDPAEKDRANFSPNNYTIYKYKENGEYYYKQWSKEDGFTEISSAEVAKLVGSIVTIPQRIFDIIQTLVVNYGGENESRVMINDLPLEIKQIVRYTGTSPLWIDMNSNKYIIDENLLPKNDNPNFKEYGYNDDVGYVYTDFVYPGSLVSSIGENICSVLDKIKSTLGNYEYFYDIDGNFVFQEIKNYLNNSYSGVQVEEKIVYYNYDNTRLDNTQSVYKNSDNAKKNMVKNNLCITKENNYKMDIHSNSKSIYDFTEGNGLVNAYINTPNYTNIKNDFHVWGETESGNVIHYHLAIKEKPKEMTERSVVFLKGKDGLYNGRLRLATDEDSLAINEDEKPVKYTPEDWRAELYLQGLEQKKEQKRPDMYQQELLDLFDDIYNMKNKEFKTDIVEKPNELKYFFDYLEPVDELYDCSIDLIDPKIYSYKNDKIRRLFNVEVPNYILISTKMDKVEQDELRKKCENQGQKWVGIDANIYKNLAIGTSGYTAQENMRELLYQYTNYNESISIQAVPIYYLDVNRRITVRDIKAGIAGDFIINSITLPLDAGGNMSISATKALERI